MDTDELSPSSFVLPVLHAGTVYEGVMCRAANTCRTCTSRECASDTRSGVPHRVCVKGVAYIPIASGWTFVGFFWQTWKPNHPYSRATQQAYTKGRRDAPDSVLSRELEQTFLRRLPGIAPAQKASMEMLDELGSAQRAVILRELQDTAKLTLKAALDDFAVVATHDLLQIVSAIYQNVQFSLASRYGDVARAVGSSLPTERALTRSDRPQVWEREKSVYYLCELAEMRLTLTRDSSILDDDGSRSAVSLHGATVKILRPYRELARRRKVELNEVGTCFARIRANYDTLHAGLLAVIDNAVKYAPPETQVRVEFEETDREAEVSLQSLGPRIDPDERTSIFRAGERGRHVHGIDGSGIGLWLAKLIVERSDGRITVAQDATESGLYRGYFRTTFTLVWPRLA